LERNIPLSELDRENLRQEYQASKTNSPTHSDPDTQKDYNNLFRKTESSSQNSIDIKNNTSQESPQSSSPTSVRRKPVPDLNLYKDEYESDTEILSPSSSKSSLSSVEDANDSTETITQASIKPENKKLLFGSGPSLKDMQIEQQAKFLEKEGDIPKDTKASDLTPLINSDESSTEILESHTYPPRPKRKEVKHDYFPSSEGVPFARGFTETLDPHK